MKWVDTARREDAQFPVYDALYAYCRTGHA